MLSLPGYVIQKKIKENSRTKIYRGYRVRGRMPVIIKVIAEKADITAGVSGFVNELEILQDLSIESILVPIGIERVGESFALITEDTGAVSLRELIDSSPLDLSSFFDISIRLADILGALHQNGIVHKNLKPENILVQPDTGKVYIVDFGKAVRCSIKAEGPYDYRDDYRSLGSVLYEMLSGRTVSQSAYDRPDAGAAGGQEALFAIIDKLRSQNPDDGYQSTYGLVKDLEECRSQCELTGHIEPFPLGRMDVPPRLKLPPRLCGREAEAEALKTSFAHASAGQGQLVLVSGYAGVGKTMLINEILRPIAMEKGYYSYGKFDQLRQNIPYAPIAAALGSVIRQLMTESSERLEKWRKRLLRAVGSNGAVLTALIPELEMIIGRQPQVETLQPKEAQNRFLTVFGNLVKIFAIKGSPIVIFLDDLQWADFSSLQLIKYLCSDTGLKYLLLVAAYRDNEVTDGHPLVSTLEEIEAEGIPVQRIHLESFDLRGVTRFIEGALNCSGGKTGRLAGVLYRKSYGIPLFLGQLLKSIHAQHLLTFNMHKGCWEWDLESIQGLQVPGDVTGLIYGKMKKLTKKSREALKTASCIGNIFDLETLGAACGDTQHEVLRLLLPAISEGLILTASGSEKGLPVPDNDLKTHVYEFLHDTVRQLAYSLLTEEQKKNIHVRIGRHILKSAGQGDMDDKMLTVLDHLNRGLDLISSPADRLRLAGYNLAAGRRAKASAAYDLAINCLEAGIKLLPEDAWNSCYRMCYDLHLELAQCKYLAGDTGAAEQLFNTILRQAESELEKTDVYGLKMELYAGTGKYSEAVQIGIDALKSLGMDLPARPGMIDIAREVLVYKWYMRNKKIEHLAELPEMKNPVQRKVAQLLIKLILATCTSHLDLYAFAIIKAGNHSIKYGNSEIASVGYLGYSITEGSVLGNYAAGHRLSEVAVRLVEEYGKSSSKCIVYFTVGALIYHWTMHGKEGLEYLYKALSFAIEAGNALIAGYSYCVILENKYLMGTALDEVLEEAGLCSDYARKMKHENLAINSEVYRSFISTLTGQSEGFYSTPDDIPDEDSFIELVKRDKASLAAYYFSNMQLSYLSGNYREALLYADKAEGCKDAIMGFMISADCNFYHSLSIAAVYKELSPKDRRRLMRVLKKNQRIMKKWADSCGDNFLHKYLLVRAEMLRVLGRKREAEPLYDKAIASAQQNGYVQNQAIACELAAKFYASERRQRIARAYMGDAYRLYREWGAIAKVRDLEKRYPDMLGGMMLEEGKKKHNSMEIIKDILLLPGIRKGKAEASAGTYDIQRAIREISEQADSFELPENFLEITIKCIGASRGYLILEKDDELFIEAARGRECDIDDGAGAIPLEKCDFLSRQVVRYVARTLEPVIIDNVEQAGIFARDPYIAKKEAKSIACIPVQLQNVPVGVMYLENNAMPGVFTDQRLEPLRLLAGQMVYAKALQRFIERDGPDTKGLLGLMPVDTLTDREMEVLKMMSKGMSNKEIAGELKMKVNTVKTHIKNIYGKLQVNRRIQAVARAKELGIL
ncbi:MAG TPA: AAA family ATPase [Clostridia bacterium]|nr:AAA family ATPase [Clostridia bacterium]